MAKSMFCVWATTTLIAIVLKVIEGIFLEYQLSQVDELNDTYCLDYSDLDFWQIFNQPTYWENPACDCLFAYMFTKAS